jgi:hypothetical protein
VSVRPDAEFAASAVEKGTLDRSARESHRAPMPFRFHLWPAHLRSVRALATALCVFGANAASAQEQDGQLWLQMNVAAPLGSGFTVTLEEIARFSDRQQGLYQTELGALASYRILQNVELGFGYRRVGAHNGNTGADEDRIRQHVVATFGRVTSRFRIDERFHQSGSQVGFRIRPLVRYNHPTGVPGLTAFASHESFFLPNSTRWGQRSGYERMRNIVGAAVRLRKGMSLDIGYLNQFRFERDGARPQMDHALTLQLAINLRDLAPNPIDD